MAQHQVIQALRKDSPLTKKELAQRLDRHRRSIERQLNSLQDAGMIATIQRTVKKEVKVNANTKGVRQVEQRLYVLQSDLEQGFSLSG